MLLGMSRRNLVPLLLRRIRRQAIDQPDVLDHRHHMVDQLEKEIGVGAREQRMTERSPPGRQIDAPDGALLGE